MVKETNTFDEYTTFKKMIYFSLSLSDIQDAKRHSLFVKDRFRRSQYLCV